MSGLAVSIEWAAARRPPDDRRHPPPRRRGDLLPRGGRRRVRIRPPRCDPPRAERPQPRKEGDLVLVADARIDSGPDLLEGFARSGPGLPSALAGDFAFVVWDSKRRSLTAARDPFGTRTLFYRAGPGRIRLASEIDQLLDGGDAVEGETIREFLSGSLSDGPRTFYRDIFRILPGHVLEAGESGLRQTRYWNPPAAPLRLRHEKDYADDSGASSGSR